MKVIIVSRYFPKKHPKAGEPTYFVEKILKGYWNGSEWPPIIGGLLETYVKSFSLHNVNHYATKHHTIRAGERWKAGEFASLRVWSGVAYRSRQVAFAQVRIESVWPFKIDRIGNIKINGRLSHIHSKEFTEIANNDGLDRQELIDWLKCHPKRKKGKYLFDGQIVCWSDSIRY